MSVVLGKRKRQVFINQDKFTKTSLSRQVYQGKFIKAQVKGGRFKYVSLSVEPLMRKGKGGGEETRKGV